MSTQSLYEQLRQRTFDEGAREGAKQVLLALYEDRFGQVPREIADAVGGMHDAATLRRWTRLVATSSREDIAAAVGVERAAS
jgi:hypothetical protein